MQTIIKLGLIGDNIAASSAPDLHEYCGSLHGLEVSYNRYVPKELGLDFVQTFEHCRNEGLTGINVTLPYKEQVVELIAVEEPMVQQIAAVNTVLFSQNGATGYNTDYSGFISAYRSRFGPKKPGIVALIGGGGVGKAIGFGLIALGADEIRLVEPDKARADALAERLQAAGASRITLAQNVSAAMNGADGVINCTPIGMVGYGGSPCLDKDFSQQSWAFDAVYTPINTPFSAQAKAVGADFISGFELFFQQGLHAFELFTGHEPIHSDQLRKRLMQNLQGRS